MYKVDSKFVWKKILLLPIVLFLSATLPIFVRANSGCEKNYSGIGSTTQKSNIAQITKKLVTIGAHKPFEVSVISEADATKLFADLSEEFPVQQLREYDLEFLAQCPVVNKSVREVMSRRGLSGGGVYIYPENFFIEAEDRFLIQQDMLSRIPGWNERFDESPPIDFGWHEASFLLVKNDQGRIEPRVFDPLFNRPLPIAEWLTNLTFYKEIPWGTRTLTSADKFYVFFDQEFRKMGTHNRRQERKILESIPSIEYDRNTRTIPPLDF